MKRILTIVVIAVIGVYVFQAVGGSAPFKQVWHAATVTTNDRELVQQIQAEGAILIHRETGETLFYKNDRKRLYPASTTKMLTALIALEKGNLNDRVTVGEEVNETSPEESRAGLRMGQQLSLHDLIQAMMLPSGNDAARTVAVYIARKDRGNDKLHTDEAMRHFVSMMNRKAQDLGAKDSHFMNPHGMHDLQHYSTARDLALIARAAMNQPTFRLIVGQQETSVPVMAGSKQSSLALSNRNRLLDQGTPYYLAGATGIKTGFTDEAGYCLVSSADLNGRSLIAVVLHSTSEGVWSDSHRLLQYGGARG